MTKVVFPPALILPRSSIKVPAGTQGLEMYSVSSGVLAAMSAAVMELSAISEVPTALAAISEAPTAPVAMSALETAPSAIEADVTEALASCEAPMLPSARFATVMTAPAQDLSQITNSAS